MGCDGGSIVGRDVMVKSKKQSDASVASDEKTRSRWHNCSLSQEPLSPPLVCDALGNLFNKEKLVEGLLGKSLPVLFSHIKGLKDVFSVTMQIQEEEKDEFMGARFVCPVTLIPASGKNRFIAVKSCGCVMSEKAVKEVPSKTCLVCGKEWNTLELGEIVTLCPSDPEEIDRMRVVMEHVREKREKEKLEKKEKKAESGDATVIGKRKEKHEDELSFGKSKKPTVMVGRYVYLFV